MSRRLAELRARFAAHQAALARWSEWVPHRPHPKQREFIKLRELEALYGGAAGGGKTDALLIDALEYVNEPDYSALLLRRTFPDLNLPGALMDRAKEWLAGTRAKWNEQDKRFTFPSGAVLQFGYCDTPNDLQRYKSAEFHRVYIDELTEWAKAWYQFLFSRIRRRLGSKIPLGMRAGTNPDGAGYGWVLEHFGIPENTKIKKPVRGPGRVFFPARAEDNPSLDLASYEEALAKMTGGRGGVKWRQLREGLWIPDGAGLVYIFEPAKNTAPTLHWKKERARWSFGLGIDYGFTNACGFSVAGWRDHDPTTYILEAFTMPELTPTEAAEVVRGLDKEYAFEVMVGDVGGLGKGYAEEGRKRFRLPIEPARKENKRGYIDLFNDARGRGNVKLVVEKCQDLRDEWKQLPWDKERKKELPGFPNHASDATLYIWREAGSYAAEPEVVKPKPGTIEALDAEEKRLEQAIDDELEEDDDLERTQRTAWWRRAGTRT